MAKTVRDLSKIAEEKTGIENWGAYLFESIHGGILVTGCRTTVITRGKNLGKLKYHTKIDRRQVFVSNAECE